MMMRKPQDRSVPLRVTFDPQADAVYIYLTEIGPGGVAEMYPCEGIARWINLDFGADRRLLGIEVLGATRRLPAALLRQLDAAPRKSGHEA